MRRSLADAILKSFNEYAVPNLPSDMPDSTKVPLLIDFTLGDLRSLKRSIEGIDRMLPRANKA